MSENKLMVTFGKFKTELADLANYIDDARTAIDTIESTFHTSTRQFPEASSQLSTVTGDLEVAANNIMGQIENLVDEHDKNKALIEELSILAMKLPEKDSKKAAIVTNKLTEVNTGMKTIMMDMFANTSFHDLSGQKLKKVISTLSTIESKILDMACSFGIKNEELDTSKTKATFADGKTEMFDQDEVDKILNELMQGSLS